MHYHVGHPVGVEVREIKRNTMRAPSIVAVLLLFSACSTSVTLAPSTTLYSQTPEQKVEIIANDTLVFQGKAVRVETDSVFWFSDDLQPHALPRSNVKAVQIKDRSSADFFKGARIGYICGLAAGVIFTQVRFGGGGEHSGLIVMGYIYIGGIGALGGGLIGGVAGYTMGNVETYVLNDSSKTSVKQNR